MLGIVALSVALGWLLGIATAVLVRLYWSTLDRCDQPVPKRRERFDARPAREAGVRIPVTRGPVQRPRLTPMDAPFDREDTQ